MLQELALGREELRIYFVDQRFHSKKSDFAGSRPNKQSIWTNFECVKKFHMEKPPNS